MIKAILFDMNGIIIDDEHVREISTKKIEFTENYYKKLKK